MLQPNLNIYPIDYYSIKKALLILRSLNHKLRQKIIETIEENNTLTVTELYVRLRMEQSVASQHLAILRRSGAVKTKREGKKIYYTVDKERISAIEQLAKDMTG